MRKYTEEEILTLLKQYVTGKASKGEFAQRIGVSRTCINLWLAKYGVPDKVEIEDLMKKANIPSTVEELQAELVKLRKEKCQLEKDLEKEKLRSLTYGTLIDMAESTYHIKVRKNSDAK